MSHLGMPKVVVTKVAKSAVDGAQAGTPNSETPKKVMVPKISLPSEADLVRMHGHINVLDLPFNRHKLYVRTGQNEEPKISMAPLVHHKPRRQPPYGRRTTVLYSGNKPVLLMMEGQESTKDSKNPTHPPECVHKLIEKPKVEPPKPPMYISKYRPQVLIESKANKEPWRLMGPPKDVSLDTSLKQQTKPKKSENARCSCTDRRPPVPTRAERPLMGLENTRDFVRENLSVTQLTEKKAPVFMDSKGRRQLLETSGLFPFYLNKKDYGKTPEYIETGRRKDEARRAKEMKDNERRKKESKDSESGRMLSDEERQHVLVKLKNTWKSLDSEHKQLPFILDNPCRLDNKVRLEEELKELEDQIAFFERPGPIVINEE